MVKLRFLFFCKLFDYLIDKLFDYLIEILFDYLIDKLFDYLINRLFDYFDKLFELVKVEIFSNFIPL